MSDLPKDPGDGVKKRLRVVSPHEGIPPAGEEATPELYGMIQLEFASDGSLHLHIYPAPSKEKLSQRSLVGIFLHMAQEAMNEFKGLKPLTPGKPEGVS